MWFIRKYTICKRQKNEHESAPLKPNSILDMSRSCENVQIRKQIVKICKNSPPISQNQKLSWDCVGISNQVVVLLNYAKSVQI